MSVASSVDWVKIETNLPSCGRVSFVKQEKDYHNLAHLLYCPTILYSEVQEIEDLVPIPRVEIEVDVPEKVKNVYQIPEGEKLSFSKSGNQVKVSTFRMQTGIVLEY